jgi:hypothetical protein
MVLYAADVTSNAKPVKKKSVSRKKKVDDDELEQELREQIENISKELLNKQKQVKSKKPKVVKKVEEEDEEDKESVSSSEHVLVKLEPPEVKLKKRKKVDPEIVKVDVPKVPLEVEEPVKEKKKRVRKPKVQKEEADVKEEVKEEPKKKKVKRSPNDPPAWFVKYVETVEKEKHLQNKEKVAAKQLKEEAEVKAQKSWENGLTRDRVRNEVDNHMSRMYKMIFNS